MFWENEQKSLTSDTSIGKTKVTIVSPNSSLVNQLLYWGYSQEYGKGVTYRSTDDSKAAAPPNIHPNMGDDDSESENLGLPAQLEGSSEKSCPDHICLWPCILIAD